MLYNFYSFLLFPMCNKDAYFNRQEYDVREERRRELEFLEKV
jgi:hypothetical protein